MSIAKPFTFVANTHAKSSEVNANFDTVYSQVNTNISAIAQNATDIDNLENNKADINGSSAQRFAVADAITNSDAINKQSLVKSISNTLDYISGFIITKDSGSPNDTIIVSEGSCYDSTKTVVLNKNNSSTKTNDNQAASATYYVYVIGNSTGSSIDILISSNSTAPTLPSGYTLYRQIGNYTTDSDSKINNISYYGLNPNSNKGSSGILNTVAPDWTNKVNKSTDTNYIADLNGWVVAVGTISGYNSELKLYINDVQVISLTLHGASGATYSEGFFLPISKGNKYKVTGPANNYYYFLPVKGGN